MVERVIDHSIFYYLINFTVGNYIFYPRHSNFYCRAVKIFHEKIEKIAQNLSHNKMKIVLVELEKINSNRNYFKLAKK